MAKETVAGAGPVLTPARATKRAEIIAFLTLAVLIWPVIAVGMVGGYGFLIWGSQIIFGPPGPPN